MRLTLLESDIYGDTPPTKPFVLKYLDLKIGVGAASY